MSSPIRLRGAASGRLPPLFRVAVMAAALAIAPWLQGCTSPPPAQPEVAADPDAPAPTTSYRPVLGGYRGARPAEPASWRERNDQAAPKRSDR